MDKVELDRLLVLQGRGDLVEVVPLSHREGLEASLLGATEYISLQDSGVSPMQIQDIIAVMLMMHLLTPGFDHARFRAVSSATQESYRDLANKMEPATYFPFSPSEDSE